MGGLLQMKCPFLTMTERLCDKPSTSDYGNCLMSECALWVEEKMCAIKAISINIGGISVDTDYIATGNPKRK